MSQLWPMVPLGEVLSQVDRKETVDPTKEYRLLGVRLEGKGPFLRETIIGSQSGATKLSSVRAGDFIYSRLFAWRGAFGIIPDELHGCYVSNEFPTFSMRAGRLDSRYLNYWFRLRPTISSVAEKCSGSTPLTRNRFKEEFFLALQIPLPPPEEQRRIVAKIEALAARMGEAKQLRTEAHEASSALVASELSAVFAQGKTCGWKAGKLDDYVVDIRYGTSEKTSDEKDGTPVLRMGNIQNGRLTLHDFKYLYLNDRDRATLLLQRGDILVNRTNSAELVGKCAVFELEDQYAYASYLIRVRLDSSRAQPRLVAAYINSPLGRAYMFNQRKQMTGQANVNSEKIKAMPIALPPIREQQQIVAKLDALQAKVDDLKAQQAHATVELNAFLPSILDRAFKGEL